MPLFILPYTVNIQANVVLAVEVNNKALHICSSSLAMWLHMKKNNSQLSRLVYLPYNMHKTYMFPLTQTFVLITWNYHNITTNTTRKSAHDNISSISSSQFTGFIPPSWVDQGKLLISLHLYHWTSSIYVFLKCKKHLMNFIMCTKQNKYLKAVTQTDLVTKQWIYIELVTINHYRPAVHLMEEASYTPLWPAPNERLTKVKMQAMTCIIQG